MRQRVRKCGRYEDAVIQAILAADRRRSIGDRHPACDTFFRAAHVPQANTIHGGRRTTKERRLLTDRVVREATPQSSRNNRLYCDVTMHHQRIVSETLRFLAD